MHAVSHLKEWEISKAEDKKHFQVKRSEAEETLGGGTCARGRRALTERMACIKPFPEFGITVR